MPTIFSRSPCREGCFYCKKNGTKAAVGILFADLSPGPALECPQFTLCFMSKKGQTPWQKSRWFRDSDSAHQRWCQKVLLPLSLQLPRHLPRRPARKPPPPPPLAALRELTSSMIALKYLTNSILPSPLSSTASNIACTFSAGSTSPERRG